MSDSESSKANAQFKAAQIVADAALRSGDINTMREIASQLENTRHQEATAIIRGDDPDKIVSKLIELAKLPGYALKPPLGKPQSPVQTVPVQVQADTKVIDYPTTGFPNT